MEDSGNHWLVFSQFAGSVAEDQAVVLAGEEDASLVVVVEPDCDVVHVVLDLIGDLDDVDGADVYHVLGYFIDECLLLAFPDDIDEGEMDPEV